MKQVWKFPLLMSSGPNYEIMMPAGAEILAVQAQCEEPCIWALVDPYQSPEVRRFCWVGTGIPFEWDKVTGHHVGTFQLAGGNFVGHLFELRQLPTRIDVLPRIDGSVSGP